MARRNEILPREVRAVLMAEWIERQRPAILAKLPTPPSSEAADAARPVTASTEPRDSELCESPGEVVHPGALARVVPRGAEGVDTLRSGVQPTCHSPEMTEGEELSRNGSATPADLSKKNGRRRDLNKSTAKEHVNHV
jgi:hypothetical protein